jgi:hypothetical protein
MREVRQALDILLAVVGSVWWILETLWLGGKALLRAATLVARYRHIMAEERPCGRGHAVPMYGLFDCHCGSRLEGWVFSTCAVCHESAAWTPCPVCGLPIRNPVLS